MPSSRRKRKNAGNIDLAVDETKIYVDENGEIIIKKNDRGIAERMIEQFMISANEAVAEFCKRKTLPVFSVFTKRLLKKKSKC